MTSHLLSSTTTTLQPIQHLVDRVFQKLRRSMLMINHNVYGDKYAAWRDLMLSNAVGEHDLLEAVDTIGKSFANDVIIKHG